MVGISNVYINAVLDQCKNLINWDGVYSSDNIPIHVINGEQNFAVIINLAAHDQVGTHFVVVIQMWKKMFIFDSLAMSRPMLPESIKHWLNNKQAIDVLNTPIQDLNSEFCGFYCIYFILWLSLPIPSKLINKYSVTNFDYTNLLLNDKKCIKMIVNMLKYQK